MQGRQCVTQGVYARALPENGFPGVKDSRGRTEYRVEGHVPKETSHMGSGEAVISIEPMTNKRSDPLAPRYMMVERKRKAEWHTYLDPESRESCSR